MEGKKSFILYADLIKIVEKLPDETAGKLFKIILKYVNDQEISIDDILLEIAFEPIRQQLKRDLEKWNSLKEKRRESGRIGGLKSGRLRTNTTEANEASASNDEANEANTSTDQANEANAFFAKQKEANEAVTVNDNVTVNVTDTVNDILLEKETKEREEKIPDEVILENPLKPPEETSKRKKVAQKKEKVSFIPPSLQEVQEYCNERQNGISSYSFVNFYQSKNWMIGKNKMTDWKAAVRTWEQKRKEETNAKEKKQGSRNLSVNR